MTCAVCSHPNRDEIDLALLKMTQDNAEEIVKVLEDTYGIDSADIKQHALLHAPFGFSPEEDSIVRQTKVKEADLLAFTALEYTKTLRIMGVRLRKQMDDDSCNFENIISKPLTDLYLGCGGGIKDSVKALADVNNLLNGPKDDSAQGLAALAQALNFSRRDKEDGVETV